VPTLLTLHRQPFAIAAFLLPFAALFQNKLLTVVLLALTVAVLILSRSRPGLRGLRSSWPILIGLTLLLLWAFASALWSIDAAHSLKRFGRLLPTVLAGVVIGIAALSVNREQRRGVVLAVAAGMLIASLLAIFGEFVRSGDIGSPRDHSVWNWIAYWSFRPFSALAAILIFPLAAVAIRGADRALMIMAIVAAVAAVLFAGASASKLALYIGLPIFLVAWRWGRLVLRVLTVVLPAAFILLPGIVTALDLPSFLSTQGRTIHSSAAHRLAIMRFVNERIDERPILGWGLHASRLLPGGGADARSDPRYADIMGVMSNDPATEVELLSLHPHNASQQMRVELGIPGVLLYALLFGLCCTALVRRYPEGPTLAAGSGALVAVFVIGQLSFSAWQSWWISAQLLCICLFLAMMGTQTGDAPADGRAAEEE
jgi:O-antigen ligase